MIAIIAEKPSVAKTYAQIVGATARRDGYFEGNGYLVTWAYGHLVTAMPPESSAPWTVESLPMLPSRFDLVAIKDKEGTNEKQLRAIKGVFDRCDLIINGGDCAREGELIQRYIYHFLGCTKPVKRLWISSLTANEIRRGLRPENLKDSREYDNLYLAGKARSEADLIVGFNGTRALTISAGSRTPLSIGRVQTPTLAMICIRFIENRDFVPQDFWTVECVCVTADGELFKAVSEKRYGTQADGEAVRQSVADAGMLTVTKVESKHTVSEAPLLFDQTALQIEASRRYGITPERSLAACQELYDKFHVLSYPRTGSSFITEDEFREKVPSRLRLIANVFPEYAPTVQEIISKGPNGHSVNDSKVTDHSALMIEETDPLSCGMTDTDMLIYRLVVERMLEAFSTRSEADVTTVKLDCGGETFSARGNVITTAGWKAVRAVTSQKPQEEKDDEQTLPSLSAGERVQADSAVTKKGTTKPKPLHTDATLLSAMETAGKDSDDENVRLALKEMGIGTAATRAGIIKELIDTRHYAEYTGSGKTKHIVPTQLGLAVYEAVKGKAIADVKLTGQWEYALNQIAAGKVSPDAFNRGILEYAKKIVEEFLSNNTKTAIRNSASAQSPGCPFCRKEGMQAPMKIYDKVSKCPRCGFVLFHRQFGNDLTMGSILQLLTKGQTDTLQFISKNGKKYKAKLTLHADKTVKLTFDDKKRRKPDNRGRGINWPKK